MLTPSKFDLRDANSIDAAILEYCAEWRTVREIRFHVKLSLTTVRRRLSFMIRDRKIERNLGPANQTGATPFVYRTLK